MAAVFVRGLKNYLRNFSGLSFISLQCILLNCIESILIGFYYFLPLYFVSDLHFNVTTAGVIISFYGFGTIIGGFLGGRLSDEWSPGYVCIISLFVQAINFFLLVKIISPIYFMFVLFCMGVASYAFITANSLWILNQCDSEQLRLQAINLTNVAANLGFGLAAVFMGLIIHINFKYVLIASALVLVCSGCYSFVINYFSRDFKTINKTVIYQQTSKLRPINKIVWVIFLCLFLVGLIIFQLSTTYSFFIQETFKSLGMKSISILFAVNCFIVVFFQAPIVSYFQHINKVLLAGIGAFLLGFGMFILIFSPNFLITIFATMIYTVGEILFFSVAQLICYQSGPSHKKGQMMGIYRMIYACSRVVAPAAGGIVYQQLGGRVLWFLCGVIGLCCFGMCNYYKKYAE